MSKQFQNSRIGGKPGQKCYEVKQYLGQLQKLETEIKLKTEERKMLLSMAAACGGQRFDDVRVQTSSSPDRMERRVSAAVDLEAQIMQDIDGFMRKRHEITEQIQSLGNVSYMMILFKRYVEHKKMVVIANELGYTYDWTKALHGRALQAFKEKYGDCIKE